MDKLSFCRSLLIYGVPSERSSELYDSMLSFFSTWFRCPPRRPVSMDYSFIEGVCYPMDEEVVLVMVVDGLGNALGVNMTTYLGDGIFLGVNDCDESEVLSLEDSLSVSHWCRIPPFRPAIV